VSQQKRALQGQLAVLRTLLASRGSAGLIVVVPVLGDRFERYPYRELHRAVADVAEAESLAVLDLLDCFSAYAFRDLRIDVVHSSPLGHRVMAHAVRDALCARGWLCVGVPAGPSCRDYRPPISRRSGVTSGRFGCRGWPCCQSLAASRGTRVF
jgi:hypothetical protein